MQNGTATFGDARAKNSTRRWLVFWVALMLPHLLFVAACGDSSSNPVVDAGSPADGQSQPHDAAVMLDSGSDPADGSTSQLENECDNWQQAHPEWLWCDDFDTSTDLTQYDDYGLSGLTVSSADALSGSHALRQHYDPGQVDAGWISKFFGDTLGLDYGPIRHEFYMRWYHKFADGFEGAPPKMARITSIGPGWDKRFGVYYWIEDYEIVADVSAQNGWLPIQRSGFLYSDPANIGRWTCHEMHVRANAPGQADGSYRFWVDGQLVIDVTDVDLVGNTDYHFNNAMLDCYWNGGSPTSQSRYYDNWVISTQPIGCPE